MSIKDIKGARPIVRPPNGGGDIGQLKKTGADGTKTDGEVKRGKTGGPVDAGGVDEVKATSETQAVQTDTSLFVAAQGHVDVTGKASQKAPSAALSQKARIMSPHLMFQDVPSKSTKQPAGDDASLLEQLLEKPFVRPATDESTMSAGPLLAKLPADRRLPIGTVSYGHEDGVFKVVGNETGNAKPETVEKKMGFGQAAHYGVAFDAALSAEYPRFSLSSSREPPEMWIGLAGAERAANMALKIDGGGGSAYDVAKTLRSFLPKAKPIVATKTVMEQINQMAGIATAVTKEGATPEANLVALEEQALNANGSSLLEEMLKDHDRKTGARTLLDDVIDQPVKPAPLPSDDKAVVARQGGREVTAGEVRDLAFQSQKAVAFQMENFADAHGSQQTLTIQVEKRGKGFEWSFHGVAGDRNRIISGEFTPAGIAKFQDVIEKQPRYDHIPYKTTVPKFSEKLTDAALGGLANDRAALEEEMKMRGGTPVSDIFPDLAL